MLQSVLDPETILVYPLRPVDMQGSSLWSENCRLLLLTHHPEEEDLKLALAKYCDSGQDYLSLLRDEDPLARASFTDDQTYLEMRKTPHPRQITYRTASLEAVAQPLLKRALEETFELGCHKEDSMARSCSSQGSILGSPSDIREFIAQLKNRTGQDGILITPDMKLAFDREEDLATKEVFDLRSDLKPTTLNTESYFAHLTTQQLGQILFHTPVVHSSMDFVSGPCLGHGVGIIPDFQTSGQGRGSNKWISPRGCAMFTLQILISLKSRLGQRLPLVQHMPGLALVQALKKISPGLDVGIKWPNDIYFEKHTKMGGILTKTSVMGSEAVVNIGVGFNLSNEKPTVSLNEILRAKGISEIGREVYLAEVFNQLESLLEAFEMDENSFYDAYHRSWIHQGQKIHVRTEDPAEEAFEAVVEGLDTFGFLSVRSNSSGTLVTVHPDGNSFDMMKGLIHPKVRP